jgi:hypothetical protein
MINPPGPPSKHQLVLMIWFGVLPNLTSVRSRP